MSHTQTIQLRDEIRAYLERFKIEIKRYCGEEMRTFFHHDPSYICVCLCTNNMLRGSVGGWRWSSRNMALLLVPTHLSFSCVLFQVIYTYTWLSSLLCVFLSIEFCHCRHLNAKPQEKMKRHFIFFYFLFNIHSFCMFQIISLWLLPFLSISLFHPHLDCCLTDAYAECMCNRIFFIVEWRRAQGENY